MNIIKRSTAYPAYVVGEGEHGKCIYRKFSGRYEHMRCDVWDIEAIDIYADELEEELRILVNEA